MPGSKKQNSLRKKFPAAMYFAPISILFARKKFHRRESNFKALSLFLNSSILAVNQRVEGRSGRPALFCFSTRILQTKLIRLGRCRGAGERGSKGEKTAHLP